MHSKMLLSYRSTNALDLKRDVVMRLRLFVDGKKENGFFFVFPLLHIDSVRSLIVGPFRQVEIKLVLHQKKQRPAHKFSFFLSVSYLLAWRGLL